MMQCSMTACYGQNKSTSNAHAMMKSTSNACSYLIQSKQSNQYTSPHYIYIYIFILKDVPFMALIDGAYILYTLYIVQALPKALIEGAQRLA